MKRNFTLFLLSTVLLSATLMSCKRKCASPDGTGLNIWLGDIHILAPSAFTPGNQDGVNDLFMFYMVNKVVDGQAPQAASLKVKDLGMEIRRGGILLFEGHGWGTQWDGKNASGKRVDGLVDVEYSLSDYDGNVAEGTFKLFVVPTSSCLQPCMASHVFGDMIHPYEGVTKSTKEQFCD